MLELKGAFQRLNQCPEFQQIKLCFTDEQAKAWEAAVKFLVDHNSEFKQIRDDVGGHFSEAAADYVLSDISGDTVGLIAIQEGAKHNTAGPKLEFAGELVTVAITRHRGTSTAEDFFENTVKLLVDGMRHVARQLHVLAYHYFWPRFGA